MLSKKDGELNKLAMELLDCKIGVFIEGIFDRIWDILVEEVDKVDVFHCAPQINCILVGYPFELTHLLNELIIILHSFQQVPLFNQCLVGLLLTDIQHPKWKLGTFHLMH